MNHKSMQSLNESLNMREIEDEATDGIEFGGPMQLSSTFSVEWKRYRPMSYAVL